MNRTTHRWHHAGVAVVALAWSATFAAGGAVPTVVDVAEDHQAVRVYGEDGTPAFMLTIHDWRAWAEEHLADALGGPVTIGDVEMEPETFHGFAVAGLAPDGRRLLVVATTYAMLTTASVLTVVDPATATLTAVADVAFGDVEALTWSPDGRYVAYALASARAFGDGLRIDDLETLRPVLELDARSALASEALADSGAATASVDAFAWLPAFRDLTWDEDATLTFRSHDPALGPEAGVLVWRFEATSGALEVE